MKYIDGSRWLEAPSTHRRRAVCTEREPLSCPQCAHMHTHTYTHTRAHTYAFLECLSLHETCEGHGVARKPVPAAKTPASNPSRDDPGLCRLPPAACSAPRGRVSAAPAWLSPPLLLSLPSLALRARSPAVPSPVGRRRPPPLPSLDSCPQAPAHPYSLS